MNPLGLTLLLGALLAPLVPAQDRMSPELLWKLGRVGGGSISPDGKSVLYSVRRYDLAANSGDSDLWTVPLAGGRARRLTEGPGSESAAQWVKTKNGVRVFFTAKRDGDSAPQVWSLDPSSGKATRVTDIAGGVANLKVSPTGTHLLFTRDVKMDPEVKDLHPDLPKADARIIDGLMYRHWNQWHDYAYSHLHVAPLLDTGKAGEAIDLMKGLKVDSPVPPFGGSEQFAWSPDGKQIAFTAKIVKDWARSTDSDIYLVNADGKEPPLCLTPGRDGYDTEPAWSPDGRWLLWHSMERAGFESDRNRIMVMEPKTGSTVEITEGLDQTCHGATWTADSAGVIFMSETRGTNQLYHLTVESKELQPLTRGRFNWSLKDVASDGSSCVVGRQSMLRPWELHRLDLKTKRVSRLTGVNDALYSGLKQPEIEEHWVTATDGKKIHNWMIKPPGFDPAKKYPAIVYCQGGPQGQIGQWFSFRWNFHLMAAKGYVVMAVNRRGLPGFGRAWNDQISKDWGGQAMQDILAATDDLVTKPYVDAERVSAVGASFGGYTVYWLMGNAKDRFASMIAHCGVFNLESMYGSTEELFFVDWDLGGPYWKSREAQYDYDRFSPHRFIKNWKTPLLVIHGEKDFRVPVTQGMEAFTAAQVEGVPSRFLYFPNEGHWVLSPQNGVLWHRTFFDWLTRHGGGPKD